MPFGRESPAHPVGNARAMSMSDVPIDDLLLPDSAPVHENDPTQAYDGGWEEGIDQGDGFEDHLLGEKPTTPEL